MEKLLMLPLDTSVFAAHWRHMDDDTQCPHPEVCARLTYVRGGRPEHPDNH